MIRFITILKGLEAVCETVLKILLYTIIVYISWKALMWMIANWN